MILRHAMKPALMPLVSFLGPAVAGVITGSIVIETIFGLPGIGRAFVDGALNRDYTLVLGVTILYGVLIVLFNLLADLSYSAARSEGALRMSCQPDQAVASIPPLAAIAAPPAAAFGRTPSPA